MTRTGLVNVGIPVELAEQIEWLTGFERLGIRGRNSFVAEAVRQHIAACVHTLLEMHEVERLAGGEPPAELPWPGKRQA